MTHSWLAINPDAKATKWLSVRVSKPIYDVVTKEIRDRNGKKVSSFLRQLIEKELAAQGLLK